ncbi:histone deacetylase 8-like [Teleopsis dalmanni]|uniref:histone deacetylase 8-like n=1 Tax=Teleopsis dalmanni TaxID=139649 RepID=UPI0018CCB7E8|nr:histone deacetylase 8-like [Teleopsis dalmanni]
MSKRTVRYVYSEYLIREADKNPAVKGRATLTHQLITSYGLINLMEILTPINCKVSELTNFHSSDYVEQFKRFERSHNTQPSKQIRNEALSSTQVEEEEEEEVCEESIEEEYGLGYDCPAWSCILSYACIIAGATITACEALIKCKPTEPEIIINWCGGWHHAHRDKAGGHCYINDIVLGILVLRQHFSRILYIDLDVHHGDGVQEAFETTKHVFTFSLHKYECGYYPGTGNVSDCGLAGGRGYTANFPYKDGIDGFSFYKYFKRIVTRIGECYNPDACVIQCGADAIVSDPLGGTNITPHALICCVFMILKWNLPTLILGGGGYNFPNTSRFWTQLTAAILNKKLCNDIPATNDNFLKYGPGYSLNINSDKFKKNWNTEEYLDRCAKTIEDNLIKYEVCAI